MFVGMVLLMATGSGEAQLSPNFYQSSCPNVESIVRQAVQKKLSRTSVTVPATLRLFFHDCFIEVKLLSILSGLRVHSISLACIGRTKKFTFMSCLLADTIACNTCKEEERERY